MSDQYNQATAIHYAAYRPPFHAMILGRVLCDEDLFNQGLDVGCGTGYSAVALAKYCWHVYGVDPSPAMLAEARPHEKITYRPGTGAALPLADKSVDVVTFAGSLFYARSELLIKELKRVCRKQALVISYDFEVLVADAWRRCGLNPEKIESDYDFEIDFSDRADFIELIRWKEPVDIDLTATELAHILLSASDSYEAFVEKYNAADPFPILVSQLERTKAPHSLKAKIYFSKYRVKAG
jgi:SAM-dependent methyltransferase